MVEQRKGMPDRGLTVEVRELVVHSPHVLPGLVAHAVEEGGVQPEHTRDLAMTALELHARLFSL